MVLTFLWESKVGQIVVLTVLGGGRMGDLVLEGKEEGRPPVRLYLSFISFSLVRLSFVSPRGFWGAGERGASMTAGCRMALQRITRRGQGTWLCKN